MEENYDLVQKGFRILLGVTAGFIGQKMNRVYKDNWWDEVKTVLPGEYNLPDAGDYGILVDSLDVANCIRLIDRKWKDVFADCLSKNSRGYAKELMSVRNIVSHKGMQDLEQPVAERALDTMALLCKEIDSDSEEEIRKIYREVRSRANDSFVKTSDRVMNVIGVAQPESESSRGELEAGSLLKTNDSEIIKKTSITKKVTFGGKTVLYPVYQVRLDALYYNDQNDRIATWISRYESENGDDSLNGLNIDIYNRVIEDFIVESNSEAIVRTQKNIETFSQREPGVILADGRVVDGNRRFTCLRRIQRTKSEPLYFETVIMDMDIQADRKQIKLLELAVQHGEEKKVDYDLIDYAIGTYRDVVQTKLLTVEEYAQSTCEPLAEVKKRIEVAQIINEFLTFINMTDKYHIAREYQVYSVFQEMMSPLNQLSEDDKVRLKSIIYINVIMQACPDQRKFIRDIKALVKNNAYADFFSEQNTIKDKIIEKYNQKDIRTKEDIDKFASESNQIKLELQASMEKALQKTRAEQLKSKPVDSVAKCISLMMDIDSRLFEKLNPDEKENLKAELEELSKVVDGFKKIL